MRRMILTAVAATVLAIPGSALASHHGAHGAVAHHKRHHRHAQLVRFGTAASTEAATPTASTPSTAPTTPTGDTAGTVASFANGVLTITLTDGSTVSVKVTEGTEIECHPAMASAASDGQGDNGGQNQQGDDNGNDGQPSSGDEGQQGEVSGHDGGDDNGQQQQEAGQCTSAALVPGAVVGEAELRVSSAGSVWEKVELG